MSAKDGHLVIPHKQDRIDGSMVNGNKRRDGWKGAPAVRRPAACRDPIPTCAAGQSTASDLKDQDGFLSCAGDRELTGASHCLTGRSRSQRTVPGTQTRTLIRITNKKRTTRANTIVFHGMKQAPLHFAA